LLLAGGLTTLSNERRRPEADDATRMSGTIRPSSAAFGIGGIGEEHGGQEDTEALDDDDDDDDDDGCDTRRNRISECESDVRGGGRNHSGNGGPSNSRRGGGKQSHGGCDSSPPPPVVGVSFRDIIGHGQAKLRLDEALLPLALPPDIADSVLTGAWMKFASRALLLSDNSASFITK
jgi:hypothetical protein